MSEDIDSPDYVQPTRWRVNLVRTVTYTETTSVVVDAISAEAAEDIVSGWPAREFRYLDWDSADDYDAGQAEVVEGSAEAEDD